MNLITLKFLPIIISDICKILCKFIFIMANKYRIKFFFHIFNENVNFSIGILKAQNV